MRGGVKSRRLPDPLSGKRGKLPICGYARENHMHHRNTGKNHARLLKAAAIVLINAGAAVAAQALTVSTAVSATDGPWQFANGGLNTAYQYGTSDETAPLVVSSANGLAFTAGTALTIDYVSGTTYEGGGYNSPDAGGDTSYLANANDGSSGQPFPSFYFPPAEYPAYLGELVGTFADSAGTIVGTPFNVGDALTVTIPAGATQLQLGLNDDIFSDNSGAYNLTIAGAAVPEPSVWLWLAGPVVFGAAVWRRRWNVRPAAAR